MAEYSRFHLSTKKEPEGSDFTALLFVSILTLMSVIIMIPARVGSKHLDMFQIFGALLRPYRLPDERRSRA